MYDDSRQDLRRLEKQLLAAEKSRRAAGLSHAEFEALYNEILVEYDTAASDPPIRNYANGYGRSATGQPVRNHAHSQHPHSQPPVKQKTQSKKKSPVRRKGTKGIVIALWFEILAIAGLGVYWHLNGYATILTVLFYQLLA